MRSKTKFTKKKYTMFLKKRGGDTKICNIILDIYSANKDVIH